MNMRRVVTIIMLIIILSESGFAQIMPPPMPPPPPPGLPIDGFTIILFIVGIIFGVKKMYKLELRNY
jgi:hypothetical protein